MARGGRRIRWRTSSALVATCARRWTSRSSATFWSGAVGYFGYDVVRLHRAAAVAARAGVDVPDALFVFTDALVIIDNLRSQARVVVGVAGATTTRATRRCAPTYDDALAEVERRSRTAARAVTLPPLDLRHATRRRPTGDVDVRARAVHAPTSSASASTSSPATRFRCCSRAASTCRTTFDATALYRALRALNPSPYMYHLVLDGVELVGSSPELLRARARTDASRVRPIAGTRPRGATPDEDAELAAELLADEKERAEHVMLVDLGRNDVGRIARVRHRGGDRLMTVERYSHVLHLVSQVEGDASRRVSTRSTRSARRSPPGR